MTHQVALTVRAAVGPGQADALRALLAQMQRAGACNDVIRFSDLPATHFARLLVVDDEPVPGAASLLLMLDCDAPAGDRLREFARVAGAGMDRVFGHCVDYPRGTVTEAHRVRFLRTHVVGSQVIYIHRVGRTLEQVRQERQLREAIRDLVDRSAQDWAGRGAREVRETIRAFVASRPDLARAMDPPARPGLRFRAREALQRFGLPLVLVLLSPVVAPLLVLVFLWLRLEELRGPEPDIRLDHGRLRALTDAEDFGAQNAITTVAPLKPGRFWRLTAPLFLQAAAFATRHVFNHDNLAGLRTVHFARLMRLDDGRFMFTSYYDGSLESYMDDFVDQVAWVLNTGFGNEDGYPKTRWLFFAGAHREQQFKAFLRGHQVATQYWYSAYPDLTATNVDNNSAIRDGLRGDMDDEAAAAWLRRL